MCEVGRIPGEYLSGTSPFNALGLDIQSPLNHPRLVHKLNSHALSYTRPSIHIPTLIHTPTPTINNLLLPSFPPYPSLLHTAPHIHTWPNSPRPGPKQTHDQHPHSLPTPPTPQTAVTYSIAPLSLSPPPTTSHPHPPHHPRYLLHTTERTTVLYHQPPPTLPSPHDPARVLAPVPAL